MQFKVLFYRTYGKGSLVEPDSHTKSGSARLRQEKTPESPIIHTTPNGNGVRYRGYRVGLACETADSKAVL